MPGIRIILMVLVISISTPALNEAQAETSTDNSAKISAEINAEVQSAWQSYLAGKYKHAAKRLKQLAKNENAQAQIYLGSLYASGHGVKINHKRAALWYERAAKQGFAPAQFNIGFLLLHGASNGTKNGIRANPKAAARWLKKAADQNVSDAQFLLCQLFHQGRGVPRSYGEATALCRKAALKGLASA
jgi:TPR repeat protein